MEYRSQIKRVCPHCRESIKFYISSLSGEGTSKLSVGERLKGVAWLSLKISSILVLLLGIYFYGALDGRAVTKLTEREQLLREINYLLKEDKFSIRFEEWKDSLRLIRKPFKTEKELVQKANIYERSNSYEVGSKDSKTSPK